MNCERKERQDLQRFDALAATPGNLVAGIVLPANAKLYASCAVDVAVATPVVVIGTASYGTPVGVAGRIHHVAYAERDVLVKKAPEAPGIVTLYVEGNFGVPIKIAQG